MHYLLSNVVFVLLKYRYTLEYFLSFRNFPEHPNDMIRRFVETERSNQQRQHRHYKMCPTHLFHQNPIFRTKKRLILMRIKKNKKYTCGV